MFAYYYQVITKFSFALFNLENEREIGRESWNSLCLLRCVNKLIDTLHIKMKEEKPLLSWNIQHLISTKNPHSKN